MRTGASCQAVVVDLMLVTSQNQIDKPIKASRNLPSIARDQPWTRVVLEGNRQHRWHAGLSRRCDWCSLPGKTTCRKHQFSLDLISERHPSSIQEIELNRSPFDIEVVTHDARSEVVDAPAVVTGK